MFGKIVGLIAIAALAVALVACSAGEPQTQQQPMAPAPAPTAAPVAQAQAMPTAMAAAQPVAPAAAMAQPEGFNTIGGSATVNDAAYDLTFFKHYGVNPFIDTEDDHLSTFAIDVDTASYTVARRFVQDGNMPHPDSVRVEEFVNFFDHGYTPPEEGAFAIHIDGSPSPFGGDKHWLVRVGLQGKEIASDARKDATLVFAIDVSGSMGREDRLGLVKRSLRLLVDELRPTDEVGIVIYGSVGSVLLEPTDGSEKRSIINAIDSLAPGGSTFAEDGLRIAYELAAERVRPGRITRVILLSDGVANVGNTGPDSILKRIRKHVDEGVTLTTVGFGMGNFNDVLMEQLANDGDGSYYYVDTINEARRVFVENLVGTLQNIAKDTKVQVDFNPGRGQKLQAAWLREPPRGRRGFPRRHGGHRRGRRGPQRDRPVRNEAARRRGRRARHGVPALRGPGQRSGERDRPRVPAERAGVRVRRGVAQVPDVRCGRRVRRDTPRELLGAGRQPGAGRRRGEQVATAHSVR